MGGGTDGGGVRGEYEHKTSQNSPPNTCLKAEDLAGEMT